MFLESNMFLLLRSFKMNRAWASFKAHPYISNIVGYTALFASADLIQQSLLRENPSPRSASEDPAGIDWHQTARVATVGLCFHANFNYHWLRGLERLVPGGGVKAVTRKVVLDQLIAAPVTISAFYIGKHVVTFVQRVASVSFKSWHFQTLNLNVFYFRLKKKQNKNEIQVPHFKTEMYSSYECKF